MDGTEVRGTLREMWDTRPSRPREGRKVAGVAAAIGRRYDVDPVLIRVGFVAAAFSGIGVPLYIAGWITLPDGPGDPRGARRPAAVVAMVVLAFLAFGGLFWGGPGDGIGALVAAVLVAGLLFGLHRSRGDRRLPSTSEPDTAVVSLVKGSPGTGSPGTGQQAPPSWDPLGAAPFAWDLPEPAQAPPPPPERRLPVTAVTLALALLAGGMTALLILTTGTMSPSSLPIVLGVVLAVLGLGLLAGSLLHAGRGIVPVAVLVGLLTWGTVAAPLEGWPPGGVGEFRVAPATVAAVQPSYSRSAGEFELDLTALDLNTLAPTAGSTTPLRTSVDLGAGEVRVLVPADADVTFTGTAGFGRVAFADRESEGPGAALRVTDLGDDGVRSGRPLEITIEAGAGDVEVRRG
ncbi:MAG: PspC domain-containing protein [Pseudonocardia sp.]|nr:PspC domain-containing protein [Pseudonocardia sp.]